jgi:hypothetical protein
MAIKLTNLSTKIELEKSNMSEFYDDSIKQRYCWGLVLKWYELRTRQHTMLKVKALRPSKHYFP